VAVSFYSSDLTCIPVIRACFRLVGVTNLVTLFTCFPAIGFADDIQSTVANSGSGVNRQRTVTLPLEATRESMISTGQIHSYKVDLPPGVYLLTVRQLGLDLTVHVTTPEPISVNSPTFRDERETVLLETSQQETFTIDISTDEYTGAVGGYSIAVGRLNDEVMIAGYRLMTEAAAVYQIDSEKNAEKALALYLEALRVWEELGTVRQQARTRLCIAQLIYWNSLSWTEAASVAADAASLYVEIGEIGLQSNAIHLQAASLIEAASEAESAPDTESSSRAQLIFDEALSLFDIAQKQQAALDNRYDMAQTLNNIGLTYHYRSDFLMARDYYHKAAVEFRRLKEWSAELNPLANLAVIDQESGQLLQAVSTYERLLELIPRDRETAWRADTLDNLAAAQLVLGNSDDALTNYFLALKLHEDISDIKGQGRSVAGIGSTYLMLGEIELARDYLERALELRRKANDGKGQVADLRVLANIHRRLGQVDVSLRYHEEALAIVTSPLDRARVEVQQAREWIDTGNYFKAEASLERATNAAEKAGATRVAANAAYQSGRLAIKMGDIQSGENWLKSALDLYGSIGLRSGQAQSLLDLARLSASDNYDTAVAYANDAIAYIEDMRSGIADLELRAVYLGTRAEYYEFLMGVLMQASRSAATEAESSAYLRQALQVSERARARTTVDLINEAAVDFSGSVDQEILDRQVSLREQLIEKQYQRDRLTNGDLNRQRTETVVAELQDIRTELDVLESEARVSNPRYADLNNPAVLSASQIRNQLDEGTVVLQYALGDASSFLWIISKKGLRGVEISDRRTINELARRVYEGMTTFDFQTSAVRKKQADVAELSKLIISPAQQEISSSSRLIVAADGALQYLPFSILSLDGESRLIDSHEIAVVPSITVIAAQREALKGRATTPKTLAVVGDPVFDATDSRLTVPARSAMAANEAARSDAPKNYGASPPLRRLPFSRQEVNGIAALVADSQRLVVTGFDAKKDRVVGNQLADYRYVHMATHGLIDARQPAMSTLMFSQFDRDGTPQNGFLRLHDIYNLQLNADLVVLSACDTALGREIRGEGLVGLTQAFLYAGTATVVASLWRVPDRATAELMIRFYENLLNGDQKPAAALRTAQLDLAEDRRWRNPYYWSGFVVQGEWR